ncbi:MAG TPA: Ig-like domain-containing protein [bacterium]|nr:Ig-like domain-containing protein [bacterium]
MERIRRYKYLSVVALALLAAMFTSTCDNPVDLLGQIEVEVLKANDRCLKVISFSPANNDQSASPTGKITLVVDRAVDMDSVAQDGNVQFRDLTGDTDVSWTPQYEASTGTLVIQSDTYLTENDSYYISVSGLMGLDGSRMLETVSFGFKAGPGPAGTVTLTGTGDPGYTRVDAITVSISQNGYATGYAVSIDATDFSNPDDAGIVWTSTSTTTKSVTLAAVEGVQHVYVIFRGLVGPEMAYSTVYLPSIIRDQTPPVVNAGADFMASTPTTIGIGYGASVAETYQKSYSWSLYSGSTVIFGTSSAPSTSVTGNATDGNRTIRFRVYDKAGNSGYDDLVMTWDNTPTLAPTVSCSTPTLSLTPTFTWSSNGTGGNGTFHHQLDSTTGSWTSTTGTSWTPSLSDGSHTLYVYETDASLGYASSQGSRLIRVTPVLPYDLQTAVSRTPIVQWRTAGVGYIYAIEMHVGKVWSAVVSGLTSTSYKMPTALDALTTYVWRVVATYGKLTAYIPSTSGSSFTTGR